MIGAIAAAMPVRPSARTTSSRYVSSASSAASGGTLRGSPVRESTWIAGNVRKKRRLSTTWINASTAAVPPIIPSASIAAT